jgi:hypothetical protein
MKQLEHRPFVLSDDTSKILSFLGLDYAKWKQGFDSRQSIFEWVFESPYANKEALLGVLPAHMDRPMYRDFVRYVQDLRESSIDRNQPDIPTVVDEMMVYFDRDEEFWRAAESVRRRKALKSCLNGKLVQEVTGLDGPLVGQIIVRVKTVFSEDELLGKSTDEMRAAIQEARQHLMQPTS